MAALLSGPLFSSAIAAQSTQPGAETPVAALAFFVGEWDQVGTVRPDARSDYLSLSGTETCSWIDDRSAVACREAVSNGADDRSDSVSVLSWDQDAGVYRMRGTDYETGSVMTGTGRRLGQTWWWDTVLNSGGARSELRYIFEDGDGGTRRLTVSLKDADGGWVIVQNVTYTRAATTTAATPASPVARPSSPRTLPKGTPRIGGSALSPTQFHSAKPPDREVPPWANLRIEVPEIRSPREADKPVDKSYPVPRLLPEGERPDQR
ncbi:hypothetical protein [Novosphingobium aquimarinum]|uniref:hypothetical protein n=1 Tax=Novosphingobium aquimarinum TaxID=2682494 RepID=UPI0012EBA924|nr:hypothetical protein [Novosphingobium aquimarinum]